MTSYRFQNGGVGKDRGKTGERPGNGKIMKVNKFSGERPGKNERIKKYEAINIIRYEGTSFPGGERPGKFPQCFPDFIPKCYMVKLCIKKCLTLMKFRIRN